MILIKNIGDSLDDLGYPDLGQLENYLADLNIVHLSKLVHWLSSNLNQISSIEATVNEITDEQEADSFKIELSSLLKELGSPHAVDKLDDLTNKLTILNYLCGELLAASIAFVKRSNKVDEEFDESEIAKQLRLMLMSLGISKPPPDVTAKQILDKIADSLDAELKKRNIEIEDSILFKNAKQNQIDSKIWSKLDELNELLKQEYEIRRRTLITRSDCTCASFKWRKELQNEELERKINEMYTKFNYLLERNINIEISDLMAIKPTDFNQLNNTVISKSHQTCKMLPTKNSKLANQGLQQQLSLHKFIIGQVPDRGGRTAEAIQPQQETFTQQQQQRQQQKNRGGFQQGNQNRQNFNSNFNPNRVQGSGWNPNSNRDWNSNSNRDWNPNSNRDFSGQQGDYQGNNSNNKFYQNNQYNQRSNYQEQDQYDNYGNQQQQQQRNRGGGQYHGNRNDGGHFNSNRGRRGRY